MFCKRNFLPISAFTICCPLPGTPLYDECLQSGRITDEIAFWESLEAPLIEFVSNLTDFSDEKLLQLKQEAEDEIRSWNITHGRKSAFD